MRKYKVSKECIACGACVEIATNNFDIGKNIIAYLKKQAENTEEETSCQQALEVCPLEAISSF
jgi:ferredoxin